MALFHGLKGETPPVVLVVDDDEGIRETVQWILEFEGYTVVTASDGIDAMEKLQAVSPRLILLDLMMPRMDGETFAQRLRQDERYRSIPILILSAFPYPPEKQCLLGIQGYLQKPFDVRALLRMVTHSLEASGDS